MNERVTRFLVFRVGERRYAFNLDDVAEVMDPPVLFPIPRALRWFSGMMNFHGTLVAVLDLAQFFTIDGDASERKVVVLDGRIANLAFLVDRIETIVTHDVVIGERAAADDLVASVLVLVDGEVSLLAAETLVGKLEETLRRL